MATTTLTQENAVKLYHDYLHLIGKPFSSFKGFEKVKIDSIKIEPAGNKGRKTVLLYGYKDSAKVDKYYRPLLSYLTEEGIEFKPSEYGL